MTAMALRLDQEDESFDDALAPGWRRPLALLLGAVAFAAVIAIGWGGLKFASRQPVAKIQIEGKFARLQIADVEAVVRPLAERTFGELDLGEVRAAVEALPWTANASVERVWPATLRVRAVERTPFARWNDAELLDADARAFAPNAEDVPDGLPQLAGPEGSERAVTEMFRALAARMQDTAFPLQGLARDARGEWTARTMAGVELRFGREDPMTKLDTLLGSAERVLKNRMSEVKHVDLRYTNGFSVGWQPPAPATKAGG